MLLPLPVQNNIAGIASHRAWHRVTDIDTDDCKSVSDSDIKAFLLKSQCIVNPLMVQSLEKTRRNGVLRSALSLGAGIRQLSRLTGVSFGIIQKLKNDQ